MSKVLLYKYREINDFTCDIIQKGMIWYSKPSKFNDLFEFRTPHYIALTHEELIAHYRKRFEIRALSDNLLDRWFKLGDGNSVTIDAEFIAKFLSSNVENQTIVVIALSHFLAEEEGLNDREIAARLSNCLNDLLWRQLENDLRNGYARNLQLGDVMGVLSLSARWDDPLMWAHYGAAGRGICIGIEIDTDNLPKEHIFLRVRYVSEPEKLDPMSFFSKEQQNVFDMILKLYATKHVRWENECEFRLLAPEGDRLYPLPGEIKEVILGIQPSNVAATRSVISLVESRNDIALYGLYKTPVDFTYARYRVSNEYGEPVENPK